MKRYLMGTVKALGDDDASDPNGSFEVILSAPTLDRDGEIVDSKIFEPLPDHITFDIDHGMSVSTTVGSGVPRYDDQGRLLVKGTYSSIPRAQEVRTLVREGHIRTTSVAFMDAKRTKGEDGHTHITGAELLNGAFVGISSNREALVISAKDYADKVNGPDMMAARAAAMQVVDMMDAMMAAEQGGDKPQDSGEDMNSEKVGAQNSAQDMARIQQIHDAAVENGAICDPANIPQDSGEPSTPDSEESGKSTSSAAPVTPDSIESGKSPASGISFGEYTRARIEVNAL